MSTYGILAAVASGYGGSGDPDGPPLEPEHLIQDSELRANAYSDKAKTASIGHDNPKHSDLIT